MCGRGGCVLTAGHQGDHSDVPQTASSTRKPWQTGSVNRVGASTSIYQMTLPHGKYEAHHLGREDAYDILHVGDHQRTRAGKVRFERDAEGHPKRPFTYSSDIDGVREPHQTFEQAFRHVATRHGMKPPNP